MDYYEKYQNLYQLFGYFPQDWKEIYIWGKYTAEYEPIVRKYKTETEKATQTIYEIKDILNIGQNFDDDDWVQILTYDLGLVLRPKAFGLSYQQWLIDLLRILEEPMEETLKHWIPKRIRE